jgi:hypothetical protein
MRPFARQYPPVARVRDRSPIAVTEAQAAPSQAWEPGLGERTSRKSTDDALPSIDVRRTSACIRERRLRWASMVELRGSRFRVAFRPSSACEEMRRPKEHRPVRYTLGVFDVACIRGSRRASSLTAPSRKDRRLCLPWSIHDTCRTQRGQRGVSYLYSA